MDEDVRHEIAIYGFAVDGHRVTVDIYGGGESTVGSLYYEIDDEERRERMLRRLEEWMDSECSLTYISNANGTGVLMKTIDYLVYHAANDA